MQGVALSITYTRAHEKMKVSIVSALLASQLTPTALGMQVCHATCASWELILAHRSQKPMLRELSAGNGMAD